MKIKEQIELLRCSGSVFPREFADELIATMENLNAVYEAAKDVAGDECIEFPYESIGYLNEAIKAVIDND